MNAEPDRWKIHNPTRHPNLHYVFTTECDARTALLALGEPWRLSSPDRRPDENA
jgi:hypothetical protein